MYDLPALIDLLTRISTRKVRVVEVETPAPSPFAASMLFGYVGAFMYNDDAPSPKDVPPHCRWTPACSPSSSAASTCASCSTRGHRIGGRPAAAHRPERAARDADDVVDLLRWLGPLSTDQIAARCIGEADLPTLLDTLVRSGSLITVTHRGHPYSPRWKTPPGSATHWNPCPAGSSGCLPRAARRPVGDLIHRYACTHGPFTTANAADHLGMAVAVVRDTF